MIKFLICCAVAASVLFFANGMGDNMLGPGRWFVLSINLCEESEKYDYQFFIQRKKLTRDQDCYNANMSLDNYIDENFAVRIELCKHVDGGCKPYQVLSDESFVRFVNKYAQSEVEKALTLAGIDPPEFPLEPGFYQLNSYVFDYCSLPTDGDYGKYGVLAFLIKDQEDVGCVAFTVEFRELDGACDGDDEYEEE